MPLFPTGRALLDPKFILAQAGLTLDEKYADFGAGTLGHFVFPATNIVGPGGYVYAVDILKSALQGIESRARLELVSNLTTVWGNVERLKGVNIPEHSLDLVSMINVSSLIKSESLVLQEAKRLLKPNGRFLVVDWTPGNESIGPASQKRSESEVVQPLIVRAGFRFFKTFKAGPYHWGMVFQNTSA
ncbi:MAG: SAM-dependent methyltransferase [Candidatus Uhrbacteria bacterium GW2011_GWE2_40_58]|nr:MAG: SAM-dependent methyltransferase [Candidatus Uhrbacteria bacterium GW2011_GWF2_40_263]KKR67475.1 MAG: SAM-dependent methyltransferase [Candidatus Uhrbacteria bacterium GW2011_GWE2_40_58]OGL94224.1 MAG: hypothetical protein A2239_03790 [Candidatus Uhrbacteria bacterium RIFOXYA2_FULL_40_9]OGL98073.1 MAG: hypothetical protein A2332_01695 [Candidatus Uhrbacteria bacterium RIFOXYB2_FULL_41_18]HBK35199.1 hypothetical protein [Candidatus Uhrbacteria bacterium]